MIPGESVSKPGRQDRMRLRVRPLPLELLERDDDLERLLDRVDAAAGLPAGVDGEVAGRGVRLHALDLDAEVHEPTLGGAQPQLGRLERDRHVGRGRALDDLARAVPDDLLVADDVEHDVSARLEALLERDLRRPHRGGEAALHVGRAAPVEAAVDDRAAEGLLRPGAPVADRARRRRGR